MRAFLDAPAVGHAAVVWVDHGRALVARQDHGRPAIVDLDRGAEPAHDFLLRVVTVAADCDRFMILGPSNERLAFERELVSVHRRETLALDVETCVTASTDELVDRLRFLEADEPAPSVDDKRVIATNG